MLRLSQVQDKHRRHNSNAMSHAGSAAVAIFDPSNQFCEIINFTSQPVTTAEDSPQSISEGGVEYGKFDHSDIAGPLQSCLLPGSGIGLWVATG